MNIESFLTYGEEMNYQRHLNKIRQKINKVCNRVSCTKVSSAKEDKIKLLKLVDSFIDESKNRQKKL